MSTPAERGTDCPDCPGRRLGVLAAQRNQPTGCVMQRVTVDAREHVPARLFEEHEVAFVRRGFVVRQRVDVRGDTTSLDVAGPGALIPLGALRRSPCPPAIYAATRTLLCLPPHHAPLDPADLVALQLLGLERIERLADARARKRTSSKVAALLCAMADTLSAEGPVTHIPAGIQQRDLAALLQVRHESVSRVLKGFVAAGLVRRDQAGLRIVNREALERV